MDGNTLVEIPVFPGVEIQLKGYQKKNGCYRSECHKVVIDVRSEKFSNSGTQFFSSSSNSVNSVYFRGLSCVKDIRFMVWIKESI